MAIRWDGSTDLYDVGSTGLDGDSSTIMMWVRLVSDRNARGTFAAFGSGGSWTFGVGSNGTSLTIVSNSADNLGSDLPIGIWNHVAIVSSAGSRTIYLNGVRDVLVASGASVSTSNFRLGNNGNSEWLDGALAACKCFTSVLSQAEIQEEMRSYMPTMRRWRNLWAWYPLLNTLSGVTDFSNQGRNFTASGTPTTDDAGPPIPWLPPRSGYQNFQRRILY